MWMSASNEQPLEASAATAESGARSESERDNRLRYVGQPGGHVESHFLKANSPDGERALWIKHTLIAPVGRPAAAAAEVWAVAFRARGREKVALKRTFPLAALQREDAPFALRLPCAELSHGHARGALDGASGRLAWELAYACPTQAFRPFPLARMYEGRFPRSKSLTPAPDTRLHGWFEAFGERWSLAGWRGAQGHNWGLSHAHAYGWVHCNVLWPADGPRGPLEGCWLEALSGRVRVGPVITPYLSVAALTIAGRTYRFDGLRALTARDVQIDARSFAFSLRQRGLQLQARFWAEREAFAGLRYEDPDGSQLSCLNAKLAQGELCLRDGARTVRLRTDSAALELGTRALDHGVALLA